MGQARLQASELRGNLGSWSKLSLSVHVGTNLEESDLEDSDLDVCTYNPKIFKSQILKRRSHLKAGKSRLQANELRGNLGRGTRIRSPGLGGVVWNEIVQTQHTTPPSTA